MGEATDVMRRKIAAFNAHDMGEMLSHFSPETVKEVPGALLRGRDQLAAFFSVFWEAFPDIEVTVTSVVEEGSVVAIQARSRGTHLGTFRTPGGDIPPTGRHIDLPLSDDYKVEGGLIVSGHLHFDRLTLLEQIGVVPAPVPA
jgi:predicted ester cyclase